MQDASNNPVGGGGPEGGPSGGGRGGGGPGDVPRLFEEVYPELCRVAERWVGRGSPMTVLQPTVLVHEAFLKLAGSEGLDVNGRTHFFAVAARAMRQILVDHARRRAAAKRGGDLERLTLSGVGSHQRGASEPVDLLALDEALRTLAALNPRHARVVEMRFFAGMDPGEIAGVLGVSRRTAELDWAAARAWLYAQLSAAGGA